MKSWVKIILCCFLVNLGYSVPGPEDTTSRFKAQYLYSFTKNIEWPSNSKQGNFVVGILGNSPIYAKLADIAATKKVVNQSIEIKTFDSPSSITSCHVLFIPNNYDNIKEVLPKVKNSYTLIVTEKPGFARQGAAINFVLRDNKILYEVNKSNAQKYDLKIGTQLLTTAAEVID